MYLRDSIPYKQRINLFAFNNYSEATFIEIKKQNQYFWHKRGGMVGMFYRLPNAETQCFYIGKDIGDTVRRENKLC